MSKSQPLSTVKTLKSGKKLSLTHERHLWNPNTSAY